MENNFKVFNAVSKEGRSYYIGLCKGNAKQNFYRIAKIQGLNYSEFKVSIIDRCFTKEEAVESVICNICYGKIFVSDWKSLNKRYEKRSSERAEKILNGGVINNVKTKK